MKRILFLIMTMLLLVPPAPAAFTPAVKYHGKSSAVGIAKPPFKAPPFITYLQKHPRLQQWALKLTQKKWFQRWMQKVGDKQRTKDTMGLIAFIAGLLLIASLFIFPAAALVLVPAAVVTGIIGISKNPNRRTYTFALIGLILGLIYLLLLLVLLALALSWTYNW